MDIMLDLESLGTRPDCAILTLGAVKFDPYTPNAIGDSLYFRIDVDEQLALGREVQTDTLEWWSKQADDVREEALGEHDRISLESMYRQLNKFTVGVENIWCQGPAFDIVILENIYRQMGWPTPWQFWQIRDSRTLFGVHGDPREKGKAGLHNALEDCISQAQGVQQIYHALKLEKRGYGK
ncbi:exonuclease [uncultured Caudovirales phage]|uniref:Exonuclease n=1 Tax=uncultured Caudovirales phage TaxID=2100421 RepID=A0A6J5L893_9CAUD|nr:exonuclease [uncultured Caudovirales phage]